jgi:hypothetical protein
MGAKIPASLIVLSACCALGAASGAGLPRSPSTKDVDLYLISPKDGETVRSPLTVRFGLRGMGVAPAGVAMESTGHHHLLIDVDAPPVDGPIPADAHHVHFGKGQTEAEVTLSRGRHRLQLLLADHLHVPHDPPVLSKPITVNVQ